MPRSLRIHLLRPHDVAPPFWYGVSRYTTEMVRAMKRVDATVEFVAFQPSLRGRLAAERRQALADVGVELRAVALPDLSGVSGYQSLVERWALPRLVDRAGCDLSWGTNCVALRRERRRFRSVVTIFDLFLLTHPELSESHFARHVAPRLKGLAGEVDLILTDSQFTGRQIVERLGADPAKVVVTHLGISPSLSGAPSADAGPVPPRLLELGWPHEGRPILSVGTVEPRKNYETGLEVYRRLRERLADVPPWLIVGRDGWKFQGFYARRERLGLVSHVRVLQGVDDALLAECYRWAHCLFCPSLVEGFGLPVLEAMTAGLPVVSSTGGALPEVGGDAVLAADPCDVEGLTDRLAILLTDPRLHDDLARRGRLRARNFSWDEAARLVLAAFRRLLS